MVPVKGQLMLCSWEGNPGLAAHWSCVTDFSGMDSWRIVREMSTLPTLFVGYDTLLFWSLLGKITSFVCLRHPLCLPDVFCFRYVRPCIRMCFIRVFGWWHRHSQQACRQLLVLIDPAVNPDGRIIAPFTLARQR